MNKGELHAKQGCVVVGIEVCSQTPREGHSRCHEVVMDRGIAVRPSCLLVYVFMSGELNKELNVWALIYSRLSGDECIEPPFFGIPNLT